MLTIEIKGVNLDKFLKNMCQIFTLKNINRISHTQIEIDIESKNYKKFVAKCNKMCYTYKIKRYSGLSWFLKQILLHLGFFVGLFVVTTCFFVSKNYLLDIDIYGLQNINESVVLDLLSKNNVYVGCKAKNDYKDVEKIIKNELDEISQLSIARKGNYLILNIKEKLSQTQITQNYDIVAEFDGVIEDIRVTQGTKQKNIGDSFKKGDILVKGEFVSMQGKIEKCKAIANITFIETHSICTTFNEYDFVNERTGKVLTQKSLIFGNLTSKKQIVVPFEYYETQQEEISLFFNFLLPIKLKVTNFYQTVPKIIKRDFEQEKSTIINNNEKMLKEQYFDKNIDKITTETIKIENGYLVVSTIQIKSSM
ncbi:MAG: sporulation protein YqfD [Clostridia bacterium]|nr:sporulation protein YqfD [Clostridia bacterium]